MRRLVRGIFLFVVVTGMTVFSSAGQSFAKSVPATPIMFNSGSSWKVYDGDTLLGNAQNVCASRSTTPVSPPNCPRNATVYGLDIAPSWQANLSAIPKARWIWAPGITGSTSPADLAAYTFTMSITVTGTPTAATLFVATDDYARVTVNGGNLGAIGSVTDDTAGHDAAWAAQSALHQFDILSSLHHGANTIQIYVQNGFDPPADPARTYRFNPAGVVFGGSISFA